jgi:hypothetical protein
MQRGSNIAVHNFVAYVVYFQVEQPRGQQPFFFKLKHNIYSTVNVICVNYQKGSSSNT